MLDNFRPVVTGRKRNVYLLPYPDIWDLSINIEVLAGGDILPYVKIRYYSDMFSI